MRFRGIIYSLAEKKKCATGLEPQLFQPPELCKNNIALTYAMLWIMSKKDALNAKRDASKTARLI